MVPTWKKHINREKSLRFRCFLCRYELLYSDDSGYNFMNPETYDQLALSSDEVGEASQFLIENLTVSVLFFNEKAVGIEVPKSVVLKVTQTDPGLKGNTVTGATKPATMETGLVVNVPLHISEGDDLKIDTSLGAYVEGSINNYFGAPSFDLTNSSKRLIL